MNILVIGAGQLGSRHLQSLMNSSSKLNIYVVDNSNESLALSKTRAEEIENYSNTEVTYLSNLNEVKSIQFFLTIIATSSAPRYIILSEVLERFDSENIILEKFLFQDIKSYEMAKSIIDKSKSSVFVNCPLRTYPIFNDIKKEIDLEGAPVFISYKGGEWVGLACNSIHYIDLMGFLSDSRLKNIDCSNVDSEIIPSKREGYIEFTGKLTCDYVRGASLELESIRNSEFDSKILIRFGNKSYQIDELSGKYNYYESSQLKKTDRYTIPYQSNLTHKILNQLVKTGSCELPKFEESSMYHQIFLIAMLEKYNEINKSQSKVLMIT
ncbi:Gfo/Idh/MocA family oxidoreductase [Gammaproteobacteria bacterium]|nr:Gfo/Idh/MocA family oxidoreductase [Gammaproteobacteria bacterium]